MGKFIKEMGLAAMMLAVSGVSASGKGNTRYYQAAVDTDAVWVATSEGLMRFDKSTGEQNTFASQGFNDITAVTVADGLVFAGGPGYRGVATFKDNLFSGIDFDTIHTQNVKSIVFADGLWVGASQMILHRLPNEEDEKFDGPEPTSSFYSFQTLAWSKEDSRMWFGVQSNTKGDKLGYVDGNSLKFIPGSSANISGLCVLEDGTVVAALHIGQYLSPEDFIPQPVRDDKVVDTPSGVVLPGVEAVGPPGIGPLPVGVEEPEGVGKAGSQQGGHLLPLLVGEAGVAPVGFGVFQVDLLMGYVQVAAVDHRLGFVQRHEVVPQVVLPAHAVVDPLQFVLGVRGVAAHQIEFLIFQRDKPPLVVVLVDIHAQGLRHGGVGGEDGGAGIALLLRRVPELVYPLPQGDIRLPPLHLGLLKTEEVGHVPLIEVRKPFFHTGPQAVYIPGNKYHSKAPSAMPSAERVLLYAEPPRLARAKPLYFAAVSLFLFSFSSVCGILKLLKSKERSSLLWRYVIPLRNCGM